MTLGYLSTPLQPCPLPACRGAAKAENFTSVVIVRCTKCGLMLQRTHGTHEAASIAEVTALWNNRPSVPAPAATAKKSNESDDAPMLHARIRDLEDALTRAAEEIEALGSKAKLTKPA